MTYLGEKFAWETVSRGKLYRIITKQTLSNKIFKDFPYTSRVLSLTASTLLHHTKMHISEYVLMFLNFLEELAFLYRKIFEKLLESVRILKMLLLHRYFSAISWSFSKITSASPKTSHELNLSDWLW